MTETHESEMAAENLPSNVEVVLNGNASKEIRSQQKDDQIDQKKTTEKESGSEIPVDNETRTSNENNTKNDHGENSSDGQREISNENHKIENNVEMNENHKHETNENDQLKENEHDKTEENMNENNEKVENDETENTKNENDEMNDSIFDDSIFQTKEKVEDYPAFAEICWFIYSFREHFEFEYNIKDLKKMFENKDNEQLIQYHTKLLRKRKIYFNSQKWENGLAKFCVEYSYDDANAITTQGYKNLDLETKLRIFLRLCESMFETYPKLKQEIQTYASDDLRPTPLGKDMFGNTYWFHKDEEFNFRLYKEDAEKDWHFVSDNLTSFKSNMDTLAAQTKEDLKLFPTIDHSQAISALTEQNIKPDTSNDNIDENAIKSEDETNDKIINKIVEENIKQELDDGIKEETDKSIKQTKKTDKRRKDKSKEKPPPPPKQRGTRRSRRHVVESEEEKDDEPEKVVEAEEMEIIQTEEVKVEVEVEENVNENAEIVQKNTEENECIEDEVNELVTEMISEIAQNMDPEMEFGEEEEEEEEEGETAQTGKVSKSTNQKKSKKRRKRRGPWYGRKTKAKPKTTTPKSQPQTVEINEENKAEDAEVVATQPPKKRKKLNEIEKLQIQSQEFNEMKRSSRIKILQQKKNEELEKEQQEKAEQEEKRRKKKETADALIAEQMREIAELSRSSRRAKAAKNEERMKIHKMRSITPERPSKRSSKKREKFQEKQSTKGKKGKKGKGKWVEEEADSSDYFDELIQSHYDDDENEQLVFDNTEEDFFDCEELDGDSDEPIVVRQARTAKAKENINDDTPCGRCGFYDNAEWILLCDKCDAGFHVSCLSPPCYIIPSGNWYCPPCEHETFINALRVEYETLLLNYEELAKRTKKKVEKKKKTLVLTNKPKVQDTNQLSLDVNNEESNDSYAPENGRRRKKKPNYTFTEFNRTINDACRDDDADDYDEEYDDDITDKENDDQYDENGVKKRKKKGHGSDDDFRSDASYNQDDGSTDENEFEDGDVTEEQTEDDEGNDFFSLSRNKRKKSKHRSSSRREKSSKKHRPNRKRRRPTRYESDETLTETEEEEFIQSESDESVYRRPRKAARKMTNYCESSTETEIDENAIEEDDLFDMKEVPEEIPSEPKQEPIKEIVQPKEVEAPSVESKPQKEPLIEDKKVEEPKEAKIALKMTISKKNLKVIKSPSKSSVSPLPTTSTPNPINYGAPHPVVSARKSDPAASIPINPFPQTDRPAPIPHYEARMYPYPPRPPGPPPGSIPHGSPFSLPPHQMHAGYPPYPHPHPPPEYFSHHPFSVPPGVLPGAPSPLSPHLGTPGVHPAVHPPVSLSGPSAVRPPGNSAYPMSNECNPHSSHPSIPSTQGSPIPPPSVQYSPANPNFYTLEPRPRFSPGSQNPHDAQFRPQFAPYPIRNGLPSPVPQQYSPIPPRSSHPSSPTIKSPYTYSAAPPPPGTYPPPGPFPQFYQSAERYPFPLAYPPHSGIPPPVAPALDRTSHKGDTIPPSANNDSSKSKPAKKEKKSSKSKKSVKKE